MPTTQEDFDALEMLLNNNNAREINEMLQSFDVTATDNNGSSCLMRCCRNTSSPAVMKLVFKKIDEAGGKDMLKSQLTARNNHGLTPLTFGCSKSPSREVMKLVFEKIIEVGGKDMLKSQFTETTDKGWTCLSHSCANSSSLEVMKLVFEKVDEAGGKDLLTSQLTAANNDGWTCLMAGCSYSSSPEVMKLIFEKIDEAGGKELLTSQLSASTTYGLTCLMLACSNSLSPEVMKLVLDKIHEAGGPDLLKSQLTSTNNHGLTCLMFACSNSKSPEVMKLLFDKIEEAGGKDFLHSQLTATNSGYTGLMLCCSNSSSPEVMKLIFEKIIEAGGNTLLNSQLTATNDDGLNSLMLGSSYPSSPEVLKLFTAVLVSGDLFQQEYRKLDDDAKMKLKEKTGIDSSSWTPWSLSITTMKLLFDVIKSIGGGDQFLKKILGTKNDAGEAPMVSLSLRHADRERLEFIMNTIEEIGGENFLAEQISRCISALLSIIIMRRRCPEPKTILETMKLLFSEIKRVDGGDQYLKELLLHEKDAGHTCLLSVCLCHHVDSSFLELILDALEEIFSEEFLAEQISKKRQSDGMTCFYALCKFAPTHESLSVLVGKIFHSEFLGRRYLREELNANPCLESVLSRPLVGSSDERKILSLMVSLYSMTGLFEEEYSRFDEEKATLRRICNIESGEWSRDSTVCDLIGEIKKSIKNKE